jgi:hypothetical protein
MTRGTEKQNTNTILCHIFASENKKFFQEKKSLLTWFRKMYGIQIVFFQTIPYIKLCNVMWNIHTAECHVGLALVCTVQYKPFHQAGVAVTISASRHRKSNTLMLHIDKYKWTTCERNFGNRFCPILHKIYQYVWVLNLNHSRYALIKTTFCYRIITSIIHFMALCDSWRLPLRRK